MKSRILMFHRVMPQKFIMKEDAYFRRGTLISSEKLEQVIQNLISKGYYFKTIQEFQEKDENIAFLTFDDGYFDSYQYVFPILRKYNIRATFYPTIGYCVSQTLAPLDYYYHYVNTIIPNSEKRNWITGIQKKIFLSLNISGQQKFITQLLHKTSKFSLENINLSYLTIANIQSLQNVGHEIGGHSMYHDIYTNLNTHEVQRDLQEMMNIFKINQIPIRSFAFTDGQYNEIIIEELNKINIKIACAIQSKCTSKSKLMQLERSFVTMDWL